MLEEALFKALPPDVPIRWITTPAHCEFPLPEPSVLKLHGGVNFLPPALIVNVQAEGSAGDGYSGPISCRVPDDDLRAEYELGVLLPFICHYAPGKAPHAQRQLLDFPQFWADWVRQSEAVIIIGCNTDIDDPHIWSPLTTSDARIYYAGSDGESLQRQVSHRFHKIGATFQEAIPSLFEIL